jgi:hypothetical protein
MCTEHRYLFILFLCTKHLVDQIQLVGQEIY